MNVSWSGDHPTAHLVGSAKTVDFQEKKLIQYKGGYTEPSGDMSVGTLFFVGILAAWERFETFKGGQISSILGESLQDMFEQLRGTTNR